MNMTIILNMIRNVIFLCTQICFTIAKALDDHKRYIEWPTKIVLLETIDTVSNTSSQKVYTLYSSREEKKLLKMWLA